LARRLSRVVTVRALFGPSRNSRVVLRAVLIALASAGAVSAVSVVELLEQGDRLTQSDEGFPDAFLRAVALYEKATAIDPQNPVSAAPAPGGKKGPGRGLSQTSHGGGRRPVRLHPVEPG